MRAFILTIGNEILLGETLDTNMAAVARGLVAAGAEVAGHVTAGDRVDEIAAAVSDAVARADVVIVTGGLGPTPDDVTREGVALALSLALRVDEGIAAQIRERFRRFGRTMPENNVRQAEVPDGAVVLPNPLGIAPGLRLESGRAVVYVLPGVPSEMAAILEGSVLPEICARGDSDPPVIHLIRTAGVPESEIAERLAALGEIPGLSLAFLPDPSYGVDLRFVFRGTDPPAREGALVLARRVLGAAIYAEGPAPSGAGGAAGSAPAAPQSLEGAVGAALRGRRATLALAESCTGGLLAKRVTDVAGSSDYFLGGFVAYSNASKTRELGVTSDMLAAHGAVSEPVARAMAAGARERLGATYGLAVTGIAGPGGGTPEKPVGLVWMGLAAPEGVQARRLQLPGDRRWVRERTAQLALDWLRREVEKGR